MTRGPEITCRLRLRLRHLRPQRRRAWRVQGARQRGGARRVALRERVNFAQQELLNPLGVNCLRYFRRPRLPGLGRAHRVARPGVEVRQRPPLLQLPRSARSTAARSGRYSRTTASGCGPTSATRRASSTTNGSPARCSAPRPKQAFFVRCDRSTMTQNDLDNGRLICLIGVAVSSRPSSSSSASARRPPTSALEDTHRTRGDNDIQIARLPTARSTSSSTSTVPRRGPAAGRFLRCRRARHRNDHRRVPQRQREGEPRPQDAGVSTRSAT